MGSGLWFEKCSSKLFEQMSVIVVVVVVVIVDFVVEGQDVQVNKEQRARIKSFSRILKFKSLHFP